jgi:DNA-binding NtrC family response regulator
LDQHNKDTAMPLKNRSDAPSKRAAPPEKDEAPRPLVLVIDDDVATRESLEYVLKGRYELLLCASAKEGLAAFRDDVCVVILDVKMKTHDGFWACDELRKQQADIPIIFYSAYQSLKDPYRIINEHRPFGYIVKDGNINKLLDALDTAVRVYKIVLENKRLIERLQGRKRSI